MMTTIIVVASVAPIRALKAYKGLVQNLKEIIFLEVWQHYVTIPPK